MLDSTWRPRRILGVPVKVVSSGGTIIGFGGDAQEALDEAVSATGWSGAHVSHHSRGARFEVNELPAARLWARGVDRDRLLRRPRVRFALESIAKLLVQGALNDGEESDGR